MLKNLSFNGVTVARFVTPITSLDKDNTDLIFKNWIIEVLQLVEDGLLSGLDLPRLGLNPDFRFGHGREPLEPLVTRNFQNLRRLQLTEGQQVRVVLPGPEKFGAGFSRRVREEIVRFRLWQLLQDPGFEAGLRFSGKVVPVSPFRTIFRSKRLADVDADRLRQRRFVSKKSFSSLTFGSGGRLMAVAVRGTGFDSRYSQSFAEDLLFYNCCV